MRLVGYLRVSTGDQSIDSAGQRHAIEQWAARGRHDIVAWEADDGISGAKGLDQRPGLAAAFELCRAHRRRRNGRVTGIVAFDRSRFSRDRNLAGMLRWAARSDGFTLLTTDGLDTRDEGMGAAAADVVADLVGEQTRQAVRKATRAALAARRDAGLVAGHIPYGYQRDGSRLVPCEPEQATVRAVCELSRGGLSLRRIADRLNGSGITTRTGGRWMAPGVRLLLTGRAGQASGHSAAPVDAL